MPTGGLHAVPIEKPLPVVSARGDPAVDCYNQGEKQYVGAVDQVARLKIVPRR
jgi:hypothetical protein